MAVPGACPEVWIGYPIKHQWKKLNFPLQLINSELGIWARVHFPSALWGPVWLRLVWALCIMPQSLSIHVCVSPVVSRMSGFLAVILPFWLLWSFCLLFLRVTWALRDGSDGDIPLRTQCSTVSHSLHAVHVWVSVFSPIYRKRKPSDDGWAIYWPMTITECC